MARSAQALYRELLQLVNGHVVAWEASHDDQRVAHLGGAVQRANAISGRIPAVLIANEPATITVRGGEGLSALPSPLSVSDPGWRSSGAWERVIEMMWWDGGGWNAGQWMLMSLMMVAFWGGV